MPPVRTSAEVPRFWRGGGVVLWPAFLMAAVLEMLVFAFVDPDDLQGVRAHGWFGSAGAVYSMAFMVFWAVISAAGFLTRALDEPQRGASPPH
jgi:hypothetical protein